jgi:hypothetical protein
MEHIPDIQQGHLDYWREFQCSVAWFTSPVEADVGIKPAVGIITQPVTPQDLEVAAVRVAWKPTEEEIEHLKEGGTIWLSCWGGLPPHFLEVQPYFEPQEPLTDFKSAAPNICDGSCCTRFTQKDCQHDCHKPARFPG